MYGLGYDVRNDDYKVVTLSYYATGIDNTPDILNTSVAVYSVRKGLWRRLLQSKESLCSNDCAVPDCASGVLFKRDLYWSASNRLGCSPDVANGVFVREIWENGVLVNGALHWLASEGSDYSLVIVAFNILEEKFFEVPGPTTIDKGKRVIGKLVALRGCLCILCETIEDPCYTIKNAIWMMKDFGIEESWTKYEVEGPDLAELIPLCLMSEEDVVLDACGSLIVYNRREDQWRGISDDRTPTMSYRAGTRTFRESLIPLTF